MKSILPKMRKAFSMLELVFVIVILGIIASIGAEIIAQIYESYILQRAQHRASVKTELAATQIANRLAYTIPGTVYRRSSLNTTDPEEITEALGYNEDTYYLLQWVGYDADSFTSMSDTNNTPGWSGFCDLDASGTNTLITPGSDLSVATDVITNLQGSVANAFVYFPGYEEIPVGVTSFNTATSTITLDNNATNWVEHYKLAWTSYALVLQNDDGTNCALNAPCNLYLYHHFSATPQANLPAASTATRSLLLSNVTNFKFRGDGKTIRFKICKSENIGEDFNVTACKEKAVF